MRLKSILGGLALATSLWFTGGQVFAQGGNPTITIDENGVGSLQFAGSAPTPLAGVLAADPGPGGLASALTYNLLGPPSLVAGDLLLVEPGSSGLANSDLVRFNPANANSGYPASVVFYSDNAPAEPGVLADTGFPTAFYTNFVTVTETGPEAGPNGFLYTPTSGQPGFVTGFAVTYNIISDPAVPEPSSFVLTALSLAIGGAGYGWKRWRRGTVGEPA